MSKKTLLVVIASLAILTISAVITKANSGCVEEREVMCAVLPDATCKWGGAIIIDTGEEQQIANPDNMTYTCSSDGWFGGNM